MSQRPNPQPLSAGRALAAIGATLLVALVLGAGLAVLLLWLLP